MLINLSKSVKHYSVYLIFMKQWFLCTFLSPPQQKYLSIPGDILKYEVIKGIALFGNLIYQCKYPQVEFVNCINFWLTIESWSQYVHPCALFCPLRNTLSRRKKIGIHCRFEPWCYPVCINPLIGSIWWNNLILGQPLIWFMPG